MMVDEMSEGERVVQNVNYRTGSMSEGRKKGKRIQ